MILSDDNGHSPASPYFKRVPKQPLTQCWGCSCEMEEPNMVTALRDGSIARPEFCDDCLLEFENGENEIFKPLPARIF